MTKVEIEIEDGYTLRPTSNGYEKVKLEDTIENVYKVLNDKKLVGKQTIESPDIVRVSAYTDLVAVSSFLNGDWTPDWKSSNNKFFIVYNSSSDTFGVSSKYKATCGEVVFMTKALAERAITIMGESKLRKLYGTPHKL